jgi:peptide-methionine (S)-S-oxide reductase
MLQGASVAQLEVGMIVSSLSLAVAAMALVAGAAVSGNSGNPSARPRAVATFAGGCFWCMQPPFDALPGVLRTTVGYTGGTAVDPSYEQVCAGGTGHAEAIEVEYDPAVVSYEALLEVFWHNIDPTTKDRQFCDTGRQYRSAIFVHDDAQRQAAERSKEQLTRSKPFGGAIMTEIVTATTFYPAEAYHQDYYKKNPVRYKYYRWGCGRDGRLKELWGASQAK